MLDWPAPFVVLFLGRYMADSDNARIAYKIINILSDNRVLPADWKWMIPIYIVQQPLPIVMNAKNLVDGIQEAMEKYDVKIDPYRIATHEGSKDYLIG